MWVIEVKYLQCIFFHILNLIFFTCFLNEFLLNFFQYNDGCSVTCDAIDSSDPKDLTEEFSVEEGTPCLDINGVRIM